MFIYNIIILIKLTRNCFTRLFVLTFIVLPVLLAEGSGAPDFLVGYHVAIEEKLDVRYVDDYYGYGYSYRARPSRRTVYAYEQGTLVLDVSLPAPKRLIWRAVARAEVSPGESQEQGDKRLAKGFISRQFLF